MPLLGRAGQCAASGVVALLLGLGCRSDAPDPSDHSKSETKEEGDAKTEAVPEDPLEGLEDRDFPLLVWAARVVETDYFDASRFDPREQLLSATTLLGLHTPEFFAEVTEGGTTLKVTVRSRSAEFPLDELGSLSATATRLEQILVFAQDVLDLETEPLHELEYAAINGLFAPLDPHTILLTPEEHTDLGVRTRGRFGGIGAQIREENRRILIVNVLPGMPAELAGVRGGDILLKIDNESTVNMTSNEAQERLRGQVGAIVKVKVRRGEATLDFEIERNTIKIDSVVATALPGGINYLRISNFQQDTADQVEKSLAGHKDTAGVVIDLRGNSGGLLAQATKVVDLFVPRGELVIVRSAIGREVDTAHDATSLADDVPVVVLVDEESASAAEIVSGGLKALGRAVVVGRSSFGKGTVQMIKPASPYGRELALKLTVAEYLVAGDERIQSFGVLPDLALQPVELSEITGIARFFDDERFERQRERARTVNLPSAKHDPEIPADRQPVGRLRYLWTAKLPKGLWDDKAGPAPEPLADPEVRLARRVALGLAGTDSSETRVARVSELAKKLGVEEDDRIVAALAKTKIDWSTGNGDGELAVSTRIVDPQPIAAGEPFTLEVSIENRASETIHRVHAITDCVHDELDGIELLVGAIAAGATETRTMRLHVMPWHTDFTDAISVDVFAGEPDETPDGDAESLFEIKGATRPELSYDYWIVDDPALVAKSPKRPPAEPIPGEPPWEVKGNGDGVLQPGEQVLLAFIAENHGKGVSPDVRAILRNLSGDQGLIEEGAVDIGELAPGQTRTAAFGITVGPHADPARPFEVELAVGDARMRTRAQDKLPFRILSDAAGATRDKARLKVSGDTVRLYAGAHASMPIVAELPEGTVVQSSGVVRGWRVVAEGARRYFVPEGKTLVADSGRSKPVSVESLDVPVAVLPPSLTLDEFPMKTSAAEVKLTGIARHPERVRDVVVLVRPPGPAQVEQKVSYAANSWTMGEEGRELSFEAAVPLSPGGNRITILARDGAKVEQRHDVWVYRESPARPAAGDAIPAGG
ncbi:MAG: MXAN_5808 family serine peptidase [Myxococcota bacterium]